MESIWRSAPTAALRLWFDGPTLRWAPNDSALAWAQAHGLPPETWPTLAEQARQRSPASGEFTIDAMPMALCRAVELPDGLLVWLELAAPGQGDSLAERSLLVAQAIGVGFWSRDLDSGATQWDAQMYRIHRREPQAGPPSFDQWLAEHVHELDRPWLAERHGRAQAKLEPMTEVTFRGPARDGELRWIQAWTRCVLRGGRRLTYGMHLDVTDRFKVDALAQEQQRADQAGRQQAQFMARMSHELRTPLNAVLGFARLLAEDPDERPTARQAERLRRVREAGSRLLAMIDGVLEIATRPAEAAVAAPAPGSGQRPHGIGSAGLLATQPDLFESTAAPAPSEQVRVVCVEDNDVNMMLVRELLALRPEVELHGACDGISGVETALRVQPDVMLLDLQLPDISGQEVMRRLRSEPGFAHCSWVALSANAMSEHIRDTLAEGFDDYWTKPIDFAQFLSGIDALVLQHRQRQPVA